MEQNPAARDAHPLLSGLTPSASDTLMMAALIMIKSQPVKGYPMTITLFQDKNFRDRSMVVTQSVADLQDVSIGKNPTSIRLTESAESILLYTRKDWDGDVHYIRGSVEVADLGSKAAGGE